MLRTFATGETYLISQPAETTAWSSRRLAMALRNVRDALHEGLAAHRQYEHLRSRGIAHDAAVRRAFGITQAGLRE
jgi:hypothetical protein